MGGIKKGKRLLYPLFGQKIAEYVQCPQSEEEHSVATICGFGDESHDLRVKTC